MVNNSNHDVHIFSNIYAHYITDQHGKPYPFPILFTKPDIDTLTEHHADSDSGGGASEATPQDGGGEYVGDGVEVLSPRE